MKATKEISFTAFAAVFALIAVAAPLYACPVCFGGSQSEGLIRGFFWGFMILLSFTFLLLSGIGYAVYQIEKRRSALEKPDNPEEEKPTS